MTKTLDLRSPLAGEIRLPVSVVQNPLGAACAARAADSLVRRQHDAFEASFKTLAAFGAPWVSAQRSAALKPCLAPSSGVARARRLFGTVEQMMEGPARGEETFMLRKAEESSRPARGRIH
jgi:hypothetical protein